MVPEDAAAQIPPDPARSEPSNARPGEYVVVARRYRPQTFDELIGQQQVARALTNAIASNRVGHAYLFTGARGVGKTSAARILAKALDCQYGPTATPCNQCDICRSISLGSDVDVIEIDGASNRGIDEIRQLRQNVGVRPSRARFKIYIIDEVHMLTKEAFNALLKTLEEPPEHVKFIFCTTEAGKIPITILSRCQRFDFAGIRAGSIQERLAQIAQAEGVEAEPEALALLARRANGSMRDSQSLLEQLFSFGGKRITASDVHLLLGTAADARLAALVAQLAERNAAGALAELDAALAEGVEVGQLLEQLLGYVRDAMVLGVGCTADAMLYSTPAQYDSLVAMSQQLGLTTLMAIAQILEQALGRLRYSTQGRTIAEIALVRIAQLENLDDLASLVAELRANPAALESARTGPPQAGASPADPQGYSASKKKTDSGPSAHIGPASHSSSVSHSALAEDAESEPAEEHPTELSWSDGPGLWRQVTSGLSGLLADFAAQGEAVLHEGNASPTASNNGGSSDTAICAPKRLVVTFPAKYNSAKQFCQRPNNLAELQESLARAARQPIVLEMTLAAEETVAIPERKITSPRQRLAEKAEHPFVRRAAELFEGELVDVKEPEPT